MNEKQSHSAPASLQKLREKLRELFMFDQADLDFGIYRIMNAKRDEITRFLDDDLLPQVKQSLAELESDDRVEIETSLAKAIEQARELGVEAETSPKVKQLRERLSATIDIDSVESEVFSHLYEFFRRYYSDGDYLSLRRYKAGVYAIPYEGEEVKLYWANADQYYIKTTENFRDFAFSVTDGRRVHFKLIEADSESDNNRRLAGTERKFILGQETPIKEEDSELLIYFEYRPDSEKRKQAQLNAEAVQSILTTDGFLEWKTALAAKAPTEKNKERTLLEKYLTEYTATNTFDYFIHKNLGGFLRRELDFYIKNEVMYLDDIDAADAHLVDNYLAKIKAIRRLAHKIIAFLAQLENFQKRMWLKKKFVIDTRYCLTLDLVPSELYSYISTNLSQLAEWRELYAFSETEVEGLQEKLKSGKLDGSAKFVMIDKRYFSRDFKMKLLSSIDNIDETINGVCIHSENFQALNLLTDRYREEVKCVYLDPPYNTNASSIPYKNNYKHSSWATLMRDRLACIRKIVRDDGAIFVSVDKTERTMLEHAMNEVFLPDNHVEELIWSMNTNNSQAPNYSTNHEYVLVYAKDRAIAEQDRSMFREPKPGYQEVMALIARLNPEYPPVSVIEAQLKTLYEDHKIAYREQVASEGLEWKSEKGNDPWKGLYNYSHAEYRSNDGTYVPETEAGSRSAQIWVWREGDTSMPATKQSETTRDPNHPNWRFYKPPHPKTGKPSPHPKRGWNCPYQVSDELSRERSFISLDQDHRIVWGKDEKKVPQLKRMLHEAETNVGKSVFVDYSDGEKQTSALFGRSGVFLAPKHSKFVSRFIQQSSTENSIVLDAFGGSGSTPHAVISLNRDERGHRKYVVVEVAGYFESLIVPRLKKVVYTENWRNGVPQHRGTGVSQAFKILKLESYEDTLNNLMLDRTKDQSSLLRNDNFREDYILHYMLDIESHASDRLLNIVTFNDPFNFLLRTSGGGSVNESQAAHVDLVETFNYLLGLRVRHIESLEGFSVVEGVDPQLNRVLVIWRNITEQSNEKLDRFFQKQAYKTRDAEFDLIYVNGDNNLENLRRADETWKVQLIEQEFQRRMFDVRDV